MNTRSVRASTKRRPNTKTIKRVFEWLEKHGLSVYGPNIDIEKKAVYPSCRDFNADEAIKACKLIDNDDLCEEDY